MSHMTQVQNAYKYKNTTTLRYRTARTFWNNAILQIWIIWNLVNITKIADLINPITAAMTIANALSYRTTLTR